MELVEGWGQGGGRAALDTEQLLSLEICWVVTVWRHPVLLHAEIHSFVLPSYAVTLLEPGHTRSPTFLILTCISEMKIVYCEPASSLNMCLPPAIVYKCYNS